MNLQWLASPGWENIVKALLHTLWQGALIAALLGVTLRRVNQPAARYRCSLAALAGVMLAAMITWAVLNRPAPQTPSNPPIAAAAQTASAPVVQSDLPPLIVNFPPAKPKPAEMNWTAWLALFWLAGATVMIARAGFQMAGAERLRRSSNPLDDSLIAELLADARRSVGLVRRVRLAATEKLTSPAVVGVLVPTLILPLSLTTSLTPEQIRFVLLHELAHIRRGDYFANLFQLFAEALLFFNPAVWWISRQMRIEREACCDALAIELSGAPADYARTLVRVAETVLHPAPAAATAFGDRREPSSLADRVQRVLVPGYRPHLRLTWRAMLAALFIGGVLLTLSAIGTRVTVAAIARVATSSSAPPAAMQKTNLPQVLIQGEIYQMREQDLRNVVSDLQVHHDNDSGNSWWLATSEQFSKLQDNLRQSDNKPLMRPRILTSSGMPAEFFVGNDEHATELDCLPTVNSEQINLAVSVMISDKPAAVTNQFKANGSMQNRGGMAIQVDNPGASTASNLVMFISAEIVTNRPATVPAMTDSEPPLVLRTFKIDPVSFYHGLGNSALSVQTNSASQKAIEFFSELSVDFKQPDKSLFFDDRQGILLVKATESDLDTIERAIQVLNQVPPQIHIKARFLELPRGGSGPGFDFYLGQMPLTNAGNSSAVGGNAGSAPVPPNLQTNDVRTANANPGQLTGILTDPNFRLALKALQSRKDVEVLGEPEVTTLSGRQTQMRATQIVTVVTNVAHLENGTNGQASSAPQTTQIETGPVLDVVPYVLADGYTIRLALNASVTNFLGYDNPTNTPVAYNRIGKQIDLPIVLPRIRIRSVTANLNLWDNQTVVLGSLREKEYVNGAEADAKSKTGDKELLIFITATIIDPAGNRVHAQDQLPPAHSGVPPQPQPGTVPGYWDDVKPPMGGSSMPGSRGSGL